LKPDKDECLCNALCMPLV